MVKGRSRNGKRTRRTRQQILVETDVTIFNKSRSSMVVENTCTDSYLSTHSESLIVSSSTGNINGVSSSNQKKSLRIIFQDAKSGKLAGRHRRTKLKSYVWPRTVEAAQSPYSDSTGKNKMYFALAIDLYPESKILQPSDTESEDEEIFEQNHVITADTHTSSEPNILCRNISGNSFPCVASTNELSSRVADDTDEGYSYAKSLSPVSPKKKRGRKPSNARRIPYGRATDIDHSWRSNYNRRCIQRRTRRQVRNRIKDPEVILDVINSVIERYSQGICIIKSTSSANDKNNNNNNSGMSSNINNTSISELRKNSFSPPLLKDGKLLYVKSDIASSEPSASDVSDVEIDVVDEDDENGQVRENICPADVGYGDADGEYEDDYEEVDDDEDDEVVVL